MLTITDDSTNHHFGMRKKLFLSEYSETLGNGSYGPHYYPCRRWEVNSKSKKSYEQSKYDDRVQTTDQENTLFGASYSMGSMSLSMSMVSMDNVGGSTDAIDDVAGYEVGLSFAF